MKITRGLTFDDVLLVPKYSSIESRSSIDTSVVLGKGVVLKIPIISANMKSITGPTMAIAMASLGGLGLLHRFFDNPVVDVPLAFKSTLDYVDDNDHIGCSVGVKKEDYDLVDAIVDAGCKIICVDVAHGHSANCGRMTEYIAKKFPQVLLISGNVATAGGALFLHNAGANIIKSGIGGGSLCSTRIETGNGFPQLSALDNIYDASFKREKNPNTALGPTRDIKTNERCFKIIADGGIRKAGDLTKSLCFADVAMLGNVLAGTDEAEGTTITIDGIDYKEYNGSSTHKTNNVEGVRSLVRSKGPVATVVKKLIEGLQSGCSYQGVDNLEDLRKNPEFVEISNSGLIESHPHDIKIRQ